jgi:RNA polymerase sigma factor (sigma-70 family)
MLSTRHDLLSADEERALIARHQAGDRRATDRLVRCNYGLVHSTVSRCITHSLERDDLTQEALIGFLRSLDTFDVSLGLRLSTYATRWMNSRLYEAYRRSGSVVRDPSIAKTKTRPKQDASLDAPADEYGHTRHEFTPDRRTSAEDQLMHAQAIKALSVLTERERIVIERRCMHEDGLREIGEDIGVTHEAVRLIEQRALRKLRAVMGFEAGDSRVVLGRLLGA